MRNYTLKADMPTLAQDKYARINEIKAKIDNAIFPSKESGKKYIEHVDMGYEDFLDLISELCFLAKG